MGNGFEASNPNDWLRTRLVAPEFHCGVPRGQPIQFAPAIGKVALLEVVQEHCNVVIGIVAGVAARAGAE